MATNGLLFLPDQIQRKVVSELRLTLTASNVRVQRKVVFVDNDIDTISVKWLDRSSVFAGPDPTESGQ